MLLLLPYVLAIIVAPCFSAAPNTTCPAKSPNTVCPIKALEVEDPSWLVDNNRLRSLGMVCRTTKTPSLTMYYIFRYFMLC